MRHFLSAADLTRDDVLELFALAADLKQGRKAGRLGSPLAGKTLALIFEKPSLRTRVTFEVGIIQLGGRAVYLVGPRDRPGHPRVRARRGAQPLALGRRHRGRVSTRTRPSTGLARHASVPVINGLSDFEHPCQALADFFTLWERGVDLRTTRLAWIGDGNNVCHSLMIAGGRCWAASIVVACPPGYEPDRGRRWRRCAGAAGGSRSPQRPAVGRAGAPTSSTPTCGRAWDRRPSASERLEAFSRYQINETLVGVAKPSALVMHCLPAHRGEEITDDVLDGPQSIVLDQAENRLHAQKAIMLRLLGELAR